MRRENVRPAARECMGGGRGGGRPSTADLPLSDVVRSLSSQTLLPCDVVRSLSLQTLSMGYVNKHYSCCRAAKWPQKLDDIVLTASILQDASSKRRKFDLRA